MAWRLDLDHARRTPWGVVYAAAGVAMVANLVGEAYARAASLCELYPQFDFAETLREELLLHHTRLPVVRTPVTTLLLLALYALVYLALRLGWVESAWLLLQLVLSGKWLAALLFVHIPAYLPFLFAEPGVPELLTDAEDLDEREDEREDALAAAPPVDEQQTQRALEKLRQVKLQHADRAVPRPDGWLVFDPEEGALVLQKPKTASRSAPPSLSGPVPTNMTAKKTQAKPKDATPAPRSVEPAVNAQVPSVRTRVAV